MYIWFILIIYCCVKLYLSYTDIDECANSNGGCNQNCTNTIGSFYCSCGEGYRLGNLGFTCDGQFVAIVRIPTCYCVTNYLTDIDECEEESDDCPQICSNTIGSYTCGCNLGYQLATDQRSCSGECLFLVKRRQLVIKVLIQTSTSVL